MTGLLICAAAVAAFYGVGFSDEHSRRMVENPRGHVWYGILGLALITVALWLAYAAGGA